MSAATDPLALFQQHRGLLFSLAYELLGSATEADDVLQDSFLRWRGVDHARVDNPRAYLVRIVTNTALSALRTNARRRETYVGPWLPEPLETDRSDPTSEPTDAVEHVLTGEAVTMAMLLVLEALTPTQRAVFVLRDVFGYSYDEIADLLGKQAATVRQVAHRARSAVQARRPSQVADLTEATRVAEQFWVATTTGELDQLLKVLAPEVVFVGDGGGVVSAARRPVRGAAAVARLVQGLLAKALATGLGEPDLRPGVFNAMPAMVLSFAGVVDQVLAVEVSQGQVTALYSVRNPAKLTRVS